MLMCETMHAHCARLDPSPPSDHTAIPSPRVHRDGIQSNDHSGATFNFPLERLAFRARFKGTRGRRVEQ